MFWGHPFIKIGGGTCHCPHTVCLHFISKTSSPLEVFLKGSTPVCRLHLQQYFQQIGGSVIKTILKRRRQYIQDIKNFFVVLVRVLETKFRELMASLLTKTIHHLYWHPFAMQSCWGTSGSLFGCVSNFLISRGVPMLVCCSKNEFYRTLMTLGQIHQDTKDSLFSPPLQPPPAPDGPSMFAVAQVKVPLPQLGYHCTVKKNYYLVD